MLNLRRRPEGCRLNDTRIKMSVSTIVELTLSSALAFGRWRKRYADDTREWRRGRDLPLGILHNSLSSNRIGVFCCRVKGRVALVLSMYRSFGMTHYW